MNRQPYTSLGPVDTKTIDAFRELCAMCDWDEGLVIEYLLREAIQRNFSMIPQVHLYKKRRNKPWEPPNLLESS